MRFVKKNRIIHIQIQEGKLLPRGNIDASTVRWVPVEDYKITDRKIYNGQDYHTFSWEKRAVDLDDLEADEGHVLTGKKRFYNEVTIFSTTSSLIVLGVKFH